MIDLTDLKLFLNLPDTRINDTILLSSIRQSVSILEGLFNRELELNERTEFIQPVSEGKSLSGFYLSCYPVTNISTIQKYSYDTNNFTDLIAPDDIPSSTLLKSGGEVMILKPFHLNCLKAGLKIIYKGGFRNVKGSGTVSVSSGNKTVIGSGSDFRSESYIGDEIKISGVIRKVDSITSSSSLTVTESFVSDLSGLEYKLSNVPEDLQQGITYLAALNFLTSSHSRESIGLSSLSTDLRIIDDNNYNTIIDGNRNLIPQRYTFTSLDLKNLIRKYKTTNI
ncbi:hypothetical protein BH10BAC5_BH10BAC5_05960 [soil metagenome]